MAWDVMMASRFIVGTGSILCAALLSCAPRVDKGECSLSSPCPRGQSCDVDNALCLALDLPTDATEDPATPTFSDRAVPFFRGEVCTVHETKAGEAFPVSLNPCLHPCLATNMFQFKHSWNCVGSSCDAYGLMWVMASSIATCPEDAFGAFDRSLCEYPNPVEFTINPVYADGRAIEGTMRLEIPFLSNGDLAEIAASPDDSDLIDAKIRQYPEDNGRVVGGRNISILNGHPSPPASCGDQGENCECFELGF